MTWEFQQIEPQPARGVLLDSMWTDPNWIAEEKYDGDRRIAQFCGHIVRFTGRRKSVDGSGFVEKSANVPHLSARPSVWKIKGVKDRDVPTGFAPPALVGTVLDGEMIVDPDDSAVPSMEGKSKFVTSIMGSKPDEAVRKQIERGWLRYVVFDCLFYKGQDVRKLPLERRKEYALTAIGMWGNPFASLAEGWCGDKRRRLEYILSRGGEGVILKNLDHRYGDKRGWVKVKGEWTADVVIMGYKDAKEMSKKVGGEISMTKYAKAGLIGAVVVGQYSETARVKLGEVATVSGMDDALRASFTRFPKKYIGSVIEIAHNGREPTGRFRHPRFKRFRDDKAAKDCIYREGEI